MAVITFQPTFAFVSDNGDNHKTYLISVNKTQVYRISKEKSRQLMVMRTFQPTLVFVSVSRRWRQPQNPPDITEQKTGPRISILEKEMMLITQMTPTNLRPCESPSTQPKSSLNISPGKENEYAKDR